MALGRRHNSNLSNIVPVVKIDCRSGKISRHDRIQDADGNWVNQAVDIAAHDFLAVMDLEHIETGWIYFCVWQRA